jgi:hypothetical protein
VCKFTLTSINPQLATIKDLYFWWLPLDNNGQAIERNNEKVIWFCKFDKTLPVSSYFTHYVDNWHKFIGGSHPMYKDYSKRGGEHMQEKVEIEYDRDMGDGDIGGDPEYAGMEQPKTKVGYWIDEDGEWITDEAELGDSLKYNFYNGEGAVLDNPTEKTRETRNITIEKFNSTKETKKFTLTEEEWEYFDKKNDREETSGICLSFKKSNTIVGADGNTQSPVTKKCAIYINDTQNLYSALMFDPPEKTDEDGNKITFPPFVADIEALPAERKGAYCKVCDYYLNEKYGASHGDKTKGVTCPWCKTQLLLKPIRKLHKQKAIGQVDFWALPGTVIDSKSYFWKNPTFINNAMIDQIEFKAYGNASNFNSNSEITNGYTKDFKGYYKPIPQKKSQEYKDLQSENSAYKSEINSKIKEIEKEIKRLKNQQKNNEE